MKEDLSTYCHYRFPLTADAMFAGRTEIACDRQVIGGLLTSGDVEDVTCPFEWDASARAVLAAGYWDSTEEQQLKWIRALQAEVLGGEAER